MTNKISFPVGKVKQVTLDPDAKILESNRWNNFSPRKIELSPIFDFPSFESYQIFYGPFLNYSGKTGFTLTAWLMGRQFVDYDFLLGRHQWGINLDYRTKIKKFYGSCGYQSPIFVTQNVKSRINFGLSYGLWENKADGGIRIKIVPYLLSPEFHEFSAGLGFRDIKTLDYVDTFDFELGGVLEGKLGYKHKFKQRRIQGDVYMSLQSSKRLIVGDFNFEKISATVRSTFIFTPNFKINSRFFGGFVQGKAPPHDEFFLCGNVRLTGISTIPFGQTGLLSPQEHIHIDGGGNCVGYYSRHIHSPKTIAFNLEPELKALPLSPFFDAGYMYGMGQSGENGLYLDAGIKVKYRPVGVYLPLWISRPRTGEENFEFRWVLELSL